MKIEMVKSDQLAQQECWLCDEKCSVNILKLHLTLKHSIKELYVCALCDWVCSSTNAVRLHQLEEHKWCQGCNVKISQPGEIVDHIRAGHEIILEARVMRVGITSLPPFPLSFFPKDPVESHQSGRFLVDKVAKVTKVGKRSVGTKLCDICGEQVGRAANMVRHLADLHESHSQYVCIHCGKMFNRPDVLRDHVRNIHDKIRIKCTECPSTFSYNSNRNTHMRKIHKK